MKKKILLALSFVLVAVLSVGLTFALLTYEDSDHNTMTLGQAEIDQLEYQRDENGKLEEFEQDQLLLPTTTQPAWAEGNQSWAEVDAPGSNQLFADTFTNVKDKFVFVKNTGSVDVYYRTIIAIEAPVGSELENGETAISLNINGNERFDWEHKEDALYIEIEGVRYYLLVANYKEVLTKDEVSRPSLLQVYMGKKATNEIVKTFGEKVDILVFSQAVQSSGYSDAKTALNDAFGEISATNHPWLANEQ